MANQASQEDLAFVRAFEAYEIKSGELDHRSHLRLAYTYLCGHDPQTTLQLIRQAILDFLVHAGVKPESKYHETITQAWILTVDWSMATTPGTRSASEFLAANPMLLDSGLLAKHFSAERLSSDTARKRFVAPDRAPIPRRDREV